ncbi:3'-5' exonuclease [Paraburkholderia sp. SUR17]|uniref:3'-5' exonuclease n=1 Tax=Paraburkholderia sp. SUR17 TaxID=3034358 RepID=UPI002407C270|nr:3'-5' exonuclease [Paraburkholderia sp. SUR17]WEY43032.1 3'-5' exonuclease [Paraburkholderia sp. SUR17]
MTLASSAWLQPLRRQWLARRLRDPAYRFMFEPPPPDEYVALDCETTGLDRRADEIISIAAVRIVGDVILTSQRFEMLIRPTRDVSRDSVCVHRLRSRDLADGVPVAQALAALLRFIGSRPLVGYYLEFDLAMLDRVAVPMLGIGLPQRRIEVSAMFYDYMFRRLPPWRQQGAPDIDLRLATMMDALGLPMRNAHDALNDAVMAAEAFLKLRRYG